MNAEHVPIRRCPDCGEEYRPHIVRCSDCGALLEDAVENEETPRDQLAVAVEEAPPEDYSRIADSLEPADAERAAGRLSADGIPFTLTASRPRGLLELRVRTDDIPKATTILEQEGVFGIPDPGARPVATEGGPCPACRTTVLPGMLECPDCGLVLGGGLGYVCRHCSAELSRASRECPQCGRNQD